MLLLTNNNYIKKKCSDDDIIINMPDQTQLNISPINNNSNSNNGKPDITPEALPGKNDYLIK